MSIETLGNLFFIGIILIAVLIVIITKIKSKNSGITAIVCSISFILLFGLYMTIACSGESKIYSDANFNVEQMANDYNATKVYRIIKDTTGAEKPHKEFIYRKLFGKEEYELVEYVYPKEIEKYRKKD